MGTFAVLVPMSGDYNNRPLESQFTVERLDINLWILPSLLARFTLICDVGVLATAGPGGLEAFDVSLPFRIEENSARDLAPILHNKPGTASLLFGEDVSLNTSLDYHKLKSVRLTSTPESASTSSTIHVIPNSIATAGTQIYVRFRVDIAHAERAIAWRRPKRRGCIVDLRVSDLREIAFVPDDLRQEQRIVNIPKLNCIVVAPAYLRSVRAHPEMHAVRILEGRVWEDYLRRALDLFRRDKYVVHFWRQQPRGQFRGFLELSRSGERISTALVTAVLSALLVWFGVGWGALADSPIGELVSWISASAAGIWEQYRLAVVGLTGSMVAALVWTVFAGRKVPTWLRWSWSKLKKMDAWIYRLPTGGAK